MIIVDTIKSTCAQLHKLASCMLCLTVLLVACSSNVEQDQPFQSVKFSAPGGTQLFRMIDASTIRATLTVHLGSDEALFNEETLHKQSVLTRVGNSNDWESSPISVTPGVTYTAIILWSVRAGDGNLIDYARQTISFIGTDGPLTIDLSSESYQFDRFDHDGDGVSNFDELATGTLPVTSGDESDVTSGETSGTTDNADAGATDGTTGDSAGSTTDGESDSDPEITTVSITLDSTSTVPPANVVGAQGEGRFEVNTNTGAISGSVTVSGTTGVPFAAHIHLGAAGSVGDVLVGLEGSEDGTVWTTANDAVLDASGIAAFKAGELYVNVHTQTHPTGELRGQLVDAEAQSPGSLTISFANTSAAMPMTPPVVVLHNAPVAPNGIRLFEESQPASLEIIAIAENGNNAPMIEVVNGQLGAGTVTAAAVAIPESDGPLLPGESASVTLELENNNQVLSVVSMIVCSNDGFSGIDSRPLSADATDTFTAPIYDAGSETNVLELDYWVPVCGGQGNLSDAENGSISKHPGQISAENSDFNFDSDDELLEITVTRNL